MNTLDAMRAKLPHVLDVGALRPDTAVVVLRGNRIDAVVPVLPVAWLSCAPTTSREGKRTQMFAWQITHDFPDASEFLDHSMRIVGMIAEPPVDAVPTTDLLDRAFTHAAVVVTGGRHPPGSSQWLDPLLVEPEARAVYFDHGRLRVAIRGDSAVGTFMAPASDGVRLSWCAGRSIRSAFIVPVWREY